MEFLFNRHRVVVWEDQTFLELNGGDGHTTI